MVRLQSVYFFLEAYLHQTLFSQTAVEIETQL